MFSLVSLKIIYVIFKTNSHSRHLYVIESQYFLSILTYTGMAIIKCYEIETAESKFLGHTCSKLLNELSSIPHNQRTWPIGPFALLLTLPLQVMRNKIA